MKFTDQVKKVANDAATQVGKFANNVSDSSKKMIEKTKLKNRISNEESTINGLFITLGKICYESGGKAPASDYANCITSINTSYEEIKNLEAKIAALDGLNNCASCGKQIPLNVKFCSFCGAPNSNYTAAQENPSDSLNEDKTVINAEVVSESDADVYVDGENE